MTEWVTLPVSSVLQLLLPLEFTACDLPVTQQSPSQLEVHFDRQEFRSLSPVTWEMVPCLHPTLFPSRLRFLPIYLPLRSLLNYFSFLSSLLLYLSGPHTEMMSTSDQGRTIRSWCGPGQLPFILGQSCHLPS